MITAQGVKIRMPRGGQFSRAVDILQTSGDQGQEGGDEGGV